MFITFEGIEGSGKSTQLASLASWLRATGRDVVSTREPGGCALGQKLRAILLDSASPPPVPEAELFMFMADRAEHLARIVRPALKSGAIVLCDRYADSTIAYQAFGRRMNLERIARLAWLWGEAEVPALTFLLDLPVELGLKRALNRNQAVGKTGAETRFDMEEQAFHERVRQGFLELAKASPARFRTISAIPEPETVFAAIRQTIRGEAGLNFSHDE